MNSRGRLGISRLVLAVLAVLAILFGSMLAVIPASAQAANCNPVIALSGGYTIETFTATSGCSWTTPANVYSADVLVIGAGGGGGGGGFDNQKSKSGGGGGGGGGAVIAHTLSLTPNQNTNVIVGSGGVGGVGGISGGSWGGTAGTSGGLTTFLSDTATGGNYGHGGGSWELQSSGSTRCNTGRAIRIGILDVYYADGIGGLGGASGKANNGSANLGGRPFCTTTLNSPETTGGAGGSGGGAGGAASDAPTSGDTYTAISPGSGLSSSITGISITYGAGGFGGNGGSDGGAGATGSTPGSGGAGGVGASTGSAGAGGIGADGIVVIKFQAITGLTLSIPTNLTYRTATTISASLAGSDGYVTFYANKVAIPGCKRIISTSLTATCRWIPQYRGSVNITATISPSLFGYPIKTSVATVSIANRTGKR